MTSQKLKLEEYGIRSDNRKEHDEKGLELRST